VSVSGSLAYNSSTGVITFAQRTDGTIRGLISVTDSGGDGSLAYNNSTGVITYTGPSASEVRAHISAGSGITVSSGAISIANDAIDSQHYAAGSIDLEHMSANSIDSTQYVDGSIDLAHMSANSVDSAQYVDGSIDTAHLADDQVTLAKMAGLTRGTIIYGNSSGNPTALALGSSGQALTSDGNDVTWGSGGKTTEEIEDIVGAMVTGNTETRFTATYDDSNAKLDFVGQTIPTLVNVLNKAGSNIACSVTNAILLVAPKTGSNISVGVT
jgi:hypothetical protein